MALEEGKMKKAKTLNIKWFIDIATHTSSFK